jgi:nicotinamide phosphoribosyltransferase
MSFKVNSLSLTDGYKPSHVFMLAYGTTRLYGTWIPRNVKHAPKGVTKIVSYGQQMTWKWLHDEFQENFFNKDSNEVLKFVKDMSLYLGMEYNGEHFKQLHDLGYLPIKVKALPEGIETNPNIPHMTFINTVDGFAWLTLYLETIVSSLAWKPSTAATIAKLYRRQAEEWVMKTDPEKMWLVDYMCHDFSARGLDPMSQYLIGLGHATSFRGSDTLPVIPAARYFYGEPEDQVCINSVNASEHSCSTTKIFTVGEQQMIADWLKIFPKGILSIVSDTFDLWKLITEYLPANKEAIMARDGKLVIRPDSGDPVDIICGVSTKYEDLTKWFPEGDVLPEYFEDSLLEEVREETPHGECGVGEYTQTYLVRGKLYKATIHNISWNRYDKQYYFIEMFEKAKITIEELDWKPSDKGVIELLWDIFGGTINEQGYKVLDPHIGAIYGDSITTERQVQIYKRLADKGFAATNIVLGVGSFTYQFNTRDTLGFAAKGAWFEVKEECKDICEGYPTCETSKCKTPEYKSYNIYKDPITDDGTKKSLKGLLCVKESENGDLVCLTEQTWEQEDQGLLQTIYEDGKFYNQTTLEQVRNRLKNEA